VEAIDLPGSQIGGAMSTRNRSKGNTGTAGYVGYLSGPALYKQARKISNSPPTWQYREYPYTTGYWGYSWTENGETMSDVIGRPHDYNGCSHEISTPIAVDHDLAVKVSPLSSLGVWQTYEMRKGHITGEIPAEVFYPSYQITTPSAPSIDWTSLVEDVGDNLDGKMEASSNLLVTLAQLGQTVGMIKHPFKSLNRYWRRDVKKLTCRQAAKLGADVWLESRYGWRNLYYDVRALALAYNEARQHLAYLAERSGRWTSYARTQTDVVPYPSASLGNLGNLSSLLIVPTLVEYSRYATFSADFRLNDAAAHWSTMDAMMQRLGTGQVLEALWDLVPFSFVVDWIINVQDLIGNDPIYWNTHRARQMGYSVKEQWKMEITLRSYATTYQGTDYLDTVVGPEVVHSKYQRVKGFPPGTSTVGLFGGLSITHLADATALVLQRL